MGRVIDTEAILRDIGIKNLPRSVVRAIERVFGVTQFEIACAKTGVDRSNTDVPRQVADMLEVLGIRYDVAEPAHVNLPSAGPLVFYANHPYGFCDALIGIKLALEKRPDTKALANATLSAFPFNTDHVVWVDLGSEPSRRAINKKSLRLALRHLAAGGALLIFPSQVCAHFHPLQGRVSDPPWSAHLARLAEHTGASCVPVHFGGHNSWRFQLLGMIHPAFRTILLLREFIDLRGSTIQVRIGAPIAASELGRLPIGDRIAYLRARVDELGRAGARAEAAESRPLGAARR